MRQKLFSTDMYFINNDWEERQVCIYNMLTGMHVPLSVHLAKQPWGNDHQMEIQRIVLHTTSVRMLSEKSDSMCQPSVQCSLD